MEKIVKKDRVQSRGLRGTVEKIQPSWTGLSLSWIFVKLSHERWGKWDSRNVSKVSEVKR
jgi:hypothetical protein